jgi:hypothetical protein
MDPVTLIVSALVTGAASAAQDTAFNAVKDAYSSLRTLLQRRFQGKPAAETALAEAETDPDTWKKPLAKAVAEHGSGEEVLALAQQLLQLLQAQQSVSSPKYNIKMDNAQGTIFEPQGPVTQHFGPQPPGAGE